MIPYLKYLERGMDEVKAMPLVIIIPMTFRAFKALWLVLSYSILVCYFWIVWGLLVFTGPISLPLFAWFAYQKQYTIGEE